MTLEKDFMGVQHWTSERFNKDIENLSPLDHIYDDDDERIKLVVDSWGDEVWVVGYTDPIRLLTFNNKKSEIPSRILGVRVRDNSFQAWTKEGIYGKRKRT